MEKPQSTKHPPGGALERAGKYLIIGVGESELGIPVSSVREILGMGQITSIPQAPFSITGVVNLRGQVIPVVDMAARLGLPAGEGAAAKPCIVVLEVPAGDGIRLTGAVVDRVSEVIQYAEDDIVDTPDYGAGIRSQSLSGVARAGGQVRFLVAVNDVFSGIGCEALLAH